MTFAPDPWIALLVPLAIASCGDTPRRAEREAPNLFVLVADDLGAELGCYGVPGATTPSLDRLAAEGTRFTRAYAPSGVCVPSRTTLYTGLDPARHGAMGFSDVDGDVLVWGEQLGRAGYRTGLIGKLGARPADRFTFDWTERTLPGDGDARDLAFHVSAFEAFLAEDDGRPWVLVVNFRDAHWPLPSDGAPPVAGVPIEAHDPAQVSVPPSLVGAPRTRVELAQFRDAVRRLDATAGALLKRLDERGERDGTLVAFTSDNGPPFPGAKTTLREWGIRQAFIVRWPGVVPPGGVDDRFVTLADVLPTALDLASAEAQELDGRSLVPLLRGEDVPWRDAVFGSHTGHRREPAAPSRSVRVGRWKYVWNARPGIEFSNLVMEVGAAWRDIEAFAERGDARARILAARQTTRMLEELYDLGADPWELDNLMTSRSDDGEVASRAAELRERLRAHLVEQRDPLLDEWPF